MDRYPIDDPWQKTLSDVMDAVDKGESKDGVMLLLKSFVSIIPRTPTNNSVMWLYIIRLLSMIACWIFCKMKRHIHYDIISSFAFGKPRMIPSWGTHIDRGVFSAFLVAYFSNQTNPFKKTLYLLFYLPVL